MRRRDFIKAFAGSASFWPLAAHAQRGERIKYELVINLRTAKTLWLTIPESVLSLTDKVIE